MRLNIATDTIDDQVANLLRDIEEIKTKQFTSQDSGMLAKIAYAQNRNSHGDIVQLHGDFGELTTSEIYCPATPNDYSFNSIYADQVFVPKHGKPAVAIPLIKLKVESGGLHGESELFISGQWGVTMPIYNSSNVEVARIGINQSLGDLFKPTYKAGYDYSWQTGMFYYANVPFTLKYEFYVRSSDDGYTNSELSGYFFDA